MSYLELRRLGRTERMVSILTLGGCALGNLTQEEADKAIEMALSYGINMIDVAPSYGDAELRLRPWLQRIRDKVFLAEKTMKRTKKEAWEELNNSLYRLGVKHFDSYQFHAVKNYEELNLIFEKGGAMEAFIEARDVGLIKYIGITGHDDVRVFIKALERFDFDTILLPIYAPAIAFSNPESDFRHVLRLAKDRDVGVVAIKSLAKGRWRGDKRYGTWYEPLDDKEEVEMALHFTLSQGVTTCCLPCDVKLWSMVLEAGKRYNKISLEREKEILEFVKSKGFKPLFPED
ncbi:MAG: aldo/keto reductase [Nitrososphaerales archaeon]